MANHTEKNQQNKNHYKHCKDGCYGKKHCFTHRIFMDLHHG